MKRFAKGGAIGLLAALAAVPAWAEMPNYDVEAHCKKLASIGGSSQSLLNACLHSEQDAYDGLKPKWDGLPEAMRLHCDHLAGLGGGSYSLLQACVASEQDASRNNEQFKFKR